MRRESASAGGHWLFPGGDGGINPGASFFPLLGTCAPKISDL